MEPQDKKLYQQVVADAKKRFNVWPSAYASGWVVRRYKELGGTYHGKKEKQTSLGRWYKEEWINVCELPKIVPCGRNKASMKDYPYCRPNKRITKDTPKTVGQISKQELQERCRRKKYNPTKKILSLTEERKQYG